MSDDCPNVSRCELFPRLKTDSALAFCLEQYCHADFVRCARYRYAQEHRAKPPADLLPNGKQLAEAG